MVEHARRYDNVKGSVVIRETLTAAMVETLWPEARIGGGEAQ